MNSGIPHTYRPTMNIVISVVAWSFIAFGAGAALFVGGNTWYLWLVPLAAFGLIVWELFWRPMVVVDDTDVTLVNIGYTVAIPWTTIVNVDTKWALTIVTPARRYRADAAPAPGAMVRPHAGKGAQHHTTTDENGALRKNEVLGTNSGDAAAIVRDRWQKLIVAEAIAIGRADIDRPRVRIHTATIAGALALIVASVPALTWA